MTEYADIFSVDPFTGTWTKMLSSWGTWDATNLELDCISDTDFLIRNVWSPGALDHEAQVTARAGSNRFSGPMVRASTTGDGYCLSVGSDGSLTVYRFVATARGVVGSSPAATVTWTAGHFYTARLEASGAAGANVSLKCWVTYHGASKPGAQDWIGVVASPTYTFTDSAADRLDAVTNVYGGIGGRASFDYDTQHDYWKVRNVSDRTAGSAPAQIWIAPTTWS